MGPSYTPSIRTMDELLYQLRTYNGFSYDRVMSRAADVIEEQQKTIEQLRTALSRAEQEE